MAAPSILVLAAGRGDRFRAAGSSPSLELAANDPGCTPDVDIPADLE